AERSSRRYGDLVEAHAQLTQEIDSRKALEAELFEARKLEAVGRLTGGFAHEFNNLLTVIAGNLDLLEIHLSEQEPLTYMHDARDAAKRGAKLIQNMLAFAQRTRLEPKVTDLNALVTDACNGDSPSLHGGVELDLVADPWPVRIDPVVAEIALINLILNAREAMPPDGRLTIRTENIHHDPIADKALAIEIGPGRYVRLSVTDEGVGIDADALPRIFDPFFTTKPIGQGTGLGLSMVMGFMKQSGGWVRALPTEGQGTTFELYFPMAATGVCAPKARPDR
ncbi:MAG: ATP-binding protein, partial [Pseudomonadota bacterium]